MYTFVVYWFLTRVPSPFDGEKSFPEEMVLGQLNFHMQKNEVGPLKLKWMNDLNIFAKTIKLLEENIQVNLYVHWFGNQLVDMISKAWGKKGKKINWTSPKFKTFVHQRTLSRKLKDELQIGRKYLKIIYLTKAYI